MVKVIFIDAGKDDDENDIERIDAEMVSAAEEFEKNNGVQAYVTSERVGDQIRIKITDYIQ